MNRGISSMSFAVFLDVDGVLNTRTTCQHTPDGYTGIDDARVEILANAIKMYNCYEVILTSDWKEMDEYDDDYLYLLEKLDLYGLYISGKTVDRGNNRGEGIINYLKIHPEIDDYVILDDYKYDFEDYGQLWERLLITDGIERAEFASRTPEVEAMIFMDYIRKYS
jgi:hypothetical protein